MSPKRKKSRMKTSKVSKVRNSVDSKTVERKVKDCIKEIKQLHIESNKYKNYDADLTAKSIINQYESVGNDFNQYLNQTSPNSDLLSLIQCENMINTLNNQINILKDMICADQKDNNNLSKEIILIEKDISTIEELKSISQQITDENNEYVKNSDFISLKDSVMHLKKDSEEAVNITLPDNLQEIKIQSNQVENLKSLAAKKSKFDKKLSETDTKINNWQEKLDKSYVKDANQQISTIKQNFQDISRMTSILDSKTLFEEFVSKIQNQIDNINERLKSSRFFDKVRILTPTDVDNMVEDAKSSLERIHQIIVFYEDEKNKFASGFKVKQQITELAQLVAKIESKTYLIQNQISINESLTVESVSMKCNEYLNSARVAVSFTPQVAELSKNHENLIAALKNMREKLQEISARLDSSQQLLINVDSKQELSGSVENQIRQIDDDIAVCNALKKAQNESFQNEIEDAKKLFNSFSSNLTLSDEDPDKNIAVMINKSIEAQKSDKISLNEIQFSSNLAQNAAQRYGNHIVEKSHEISHDFSSQNKNIFDISQDLKTLQSQINNHIANMKNTAIPESSLKHIKAKTNEVDQKISKDLINLRKLANDAKDDTVILTNHDIKKVKAETPKLQMINENLLQSARIIHPYLSSIDKYVTKLDSKIHKALNGQDIAEIPKNPQNEKGEDFSFEEAEKRADILANNAINSSMSLESISENVKIYEKQFSKVEELHKFVQKIDQMENVTTQQLINPSSSKLKLPKDATVSGVNSQMKKLQQRMTKL